MGSDFDFTRFSQALAAVRSLGVEWKGSRFDTYLESLRVATSKLILSARVQPELLFEAAGQLFLLVLASRVFGRLDTGILKKKVSLVIAGSVLPNPKSDSDPARDTLLELVAAALLCDRGFEPAITAVDADLLLRNETYERVVVECKRPSSWRSALRKTRKQLFKRTSMARDLGVAVFAVEKIVPTTLRVRTDVHARALVDEQFERAQHQLRKLDQERSARGQRPFRLSPYAPVVILVSSGAFLIEAPDSLTLMPYAVQKPVPTCPPGEVPPALDSILRGGAQSDLLTDIRTAGFGPAIGASL